MSDTILLGISGPSSSGKTTLARLLRSILLSAGHHAFILHEDDFYWPDTEIPIHVETGYQDWDCLESIDVNFFKSALQHIKQIGRLPDSLKSKEDQNSVGKVSVDDSVIQELKQRTETLPLSAGSTVAIIDGFLLYTPALEVLHSLLDVKLFLPTTHSLMSTRRSARTGYVTLEGFWEDPPGYVDKVVWPNYAKDHAFMFEEGDVQGTIKEAVVRSLRVQVAPSAAREDMSACLQWAWDMFEESLKSDFSKADRRPA